MEISTGMRYVNVFVYGICIHLLVPVSGLDSPEATLHKKLFGDYNPNVMPQLNKQTPVNATIDMFLMSIENINEKRQTITIKAFLEIKWKDAFLTWDPKDYQGVSRITVKDNDIWIPDISLHNTFDKLTELGQGDGRVIIKSDGLVTIWPYKIYTVACKISVSKFPFDKQTCIFDFLSWSHPNSVLVLNSLQKKPDMSFFSESVEWDLTVSEVKLTKRQYGADAWDHVLFYFELNRKSLYHVVNMIVPVLCISILNVVSFVLPSPSGERVTLSISIFLTLAVFLTTVNSSMPESSDEVAVFSIFVGLQLLGSAFTIFFTIISLNLFHHERSDKIPGVVKAFVKICRVSKTNEDYRIGAHAPNGNATYLSNEQIKLSEECEPTTWKMVSRAIDKLCFLSAICWHIVLTASFLISATN